MEEQLTTIYKALHANIMFQVKTPFIAFAASFSHHTGALKLLYDIIIILCA